MNRTPLLSVAASSSSSFPYSYRRPLMNPTPPFTGGASSSSSSSSSSRDSSSFRRPAVDMTPARHLFEELRDRRTRERALFLLNKDWAVFDDFAPLLWHSFGVIATILQEIVSVYVSLHSPYLTDQKSNQVCNALSLLQCVACHPDTKILFLKAKVQCYLYPFLSNRSTGIQQQNLRLNSLGVIGALVKVDDSEVITPLVQSEVVPNCLCSMEVGDNQSKTVATFIIYKILLNEKGLHYSLVLAERFFSMVHVLQSMVEKLAEDRNLADDSSKRLLKHIIWCYHRLSESPRACGGLKQSLPPLLRDVTFIHILRDDEMALRCLQLLFHNIATNCRVREQRAEQSINHLSDPHALQLPYPYGGQPAASLLDRFNRGLRLD